MEEAEYIPAMDDAEIDDEDTSVIEALRDSDKPEDTLRAQVMARKKILRLAGK